jgi:hypothetical protein
LIHLEDGLEIWWRRYEANDVTSKPILYKNQCSLKTGRTFINLNLKTLLFLFQFYLLILRFRAFFANLVEQEKALKSLNQYYQFNMVL